MGTVDAIMRLITQHKRGVISESELRQDVLEIVLDDRHEILAAERNGTLYIAAGR